MEFRRQVGILAGNSPNVLKNLCGKKRIVGGRQQKCRNPNPRQEADRAAAIVIVVRALESVHWRCDAIVELVEGARAHSSCLVEQVRNARCFREGLPPQRAKKRTIVNAKRPFGYSPSTGFEIERNADGSCRGDERLGVVAVLPEPPQYHTAAERNTGEQPM